MKMDARVKGLWLEALESDEFKQGTSQLRHGDRYCCLGVLSELHRREHPDAEWRKGTWGCAAMNGLEVDSDDYTYFDGTNRTEGEPVSLTPAVAEWAGLEYGDDGEPTFDPYVKAAYPGGEPDLHNLSTLNDSGWTFRQIAELIRAQM